MPVLNIPAALAAVKDDEDYLADILEELLERQPELIETLQNAADRSGQVRSGPGSCRVGAVGWLVWTAGLLWSGPSLLCSALQLLPNNLGLRDSSNLFFLLTLHHACVHVRVRVRARVCHGNGRVVRWAWAVAFFLGGGGRCAAVWLFVARCCCCCGGGVWLAGCGPCGRSVRRTRSGQPSTFYRAANAVKLLVQDFAMEGLRFAALRAEQCAKDVEKKVGRYGELV